MNSGKLPNNPVTTSSLHAQPAVRASKAGKPTLQVLSSIGIALFIAVLGYAVWLAGRSSGIIEGTEKSPDRIVFSGNSAVSPADLQKQIDAAAKAAMGPDESLLDKLLLLVGAYSTILSFLALATVIVSRQDAKDQLANVKDNAKELETKITDDIEAIRLKAEKDVEDLKTQVRSEFPIVSQLQRRVRNLILELEAKYPEDENSAKKRPSTWKSEVQQQGAMIDELQTVAVSVVVLDQEDLLKLYLVLARCYLVRFRTGNQTDNDAARAYLYADRAVNTSSSSSEAYRIRGVSALLRYQSAEADRKKTSEFVELLKDAKADLIEAKKLDPSELGAYFNLAYALYEEGNRPEAIRMSEEALADLTTFFRNRKEKYLPDIYVNFACYLADDFREEKNEDTKTVLCKRIVTICTEGRDYLRDNVKSSRANEEFRANIIKELADKGDFRGLPAATRDSLEALTQLVVPEKGRQ